MDEITITTAAHIALQETMEQAREFADSAKSANTRRAYRSDFQHFATWCSDRALSSLPATPETMALYLTDLAATYKMATIERKRAAIVEAHKLANYESPTGGTARVVMQGIRRKLGKAQKRKTAATVPHLVRMVSTCEDTTLGIRDRALLLFGFAGAFRRSELVALDYDDLEMVPDGIAVTIRRSKTDQVGEGRKVGIPYGDNQRTCPVRALTVWLKLAGITTGAIFRSVDRHGNISPKRLTAQSVALVVKKAANACGLDESLFAGHSLRAGLATSAAAAGVEERAIANQTGHRSTTILRRYIRDGSLFTNNAAKKVGL